LQGTLTEIAREAAIACNADVAIIGLLTLDAKELEVVAEFRARSRVVGKRYPVTPALLDTLIREGESFRSADVFSDPHPLAVDLRARGRQVPQAILMIALRTREGPLAVFSVGRRTASGFTDADEARLGHIAARARTAIVSARLRGPAEPPPGETPSAADVGSLPHLTPREREIVTLLAGDKSCKEVASTLGLSPRTVEHHVERLKFRYRQTTLHGLVGYLVRMKA
jgi:DNA-binding CsgD family transcriptional regulator